MLCPTRWTVRGKSLQSILDNYLVLQELWDEVLAGSVDPDVRARVIGVKAQMETFNFFFGISLARLVLAHGDNLSVSLQSSTMSAAEAQKIAHLTVNTITKMRTENSFSMFWEATVAKSHQFDVSEPQFPRKRKRPQRYEGGDEPAYHPSSPEGHFWQLYFEVLDSAKSSIQTRFNQKDFAIYTQMENLLLKSAKGVDATDEFKAVTELYGEDIDSNLLLTQFSLLQTQLTSDDDVTFRSVLKFLRGYSTSQRQLLFEVVKLVRLILVSPATNAISERSFSAMRRIKTYLRSTMGQSRLNSVMLLQTHKDRTDALSVLWSRAMPSSMSPAVITAAQYLAHSRMLILQLSNPASSLPGIALLVFFLRLWLSYTAAGPCTVIIILLIVSMHIVRHLSHYFLPAFLFLASFAEGFRTPIQWWMR